MTNPRFNLDTFDPDSARDITPPTLDRRQFLRRAASATCVLVVGGGVYRAQRQGVFSTAQGVAFEPWYDWRNQPEAGALRLVQAAILAANPHNTQPWLFHVQEDGQQTGSIDVYADMSRHLGTMDPYCREMMLGIGCALENMHLAAQVNGYDVQTQLEPATLQLENTSDPVQVARMTFRSQAVPTHSDLYDAIALRHTDRSNYRQEAIAPQLLEQMLTLVDDENVQLSTFTSDSQAFTRLAEATVQATEFIIGDSEMSRDSHAWFKHSWQQVQRDRDGPFIDTSGVSPWLRAVVKMLPPMSHARMDAGWLAGTRSSLQATPVLGFIAVRDLYAQDQNLQAGRFWQRLHLWAVRRGLAAQPINQVVERVDRERQLGQPPVTAALLDSLTEDATWRPTFAFRMGYPTQTALPSARRGLAEVRYEQIS